MYTVTCYSYAYISLQWLRFAFSANACQRSTIQCHSPNDYLVMLSSSQFE